MKKSFKISQTGMTLLELLIAITIGLFIIGAALMVFQNVSGIGSQISEVAQLRQQGMHAFRVIGKQINEAGSIEPDYLSNNGNYKFKADYGWVNTTDKSPISSWTAPGGGNYLSISQQEQSSTVYRGLLLNCLGNQVTSSSRSSNFFLKAVPGDDSNTLMCYTGTGIGQTQPIINDVAAFSVLYRVRTSSMNLENKRFVETPTNWSLVDAVEVCIDLIGKRSNPTKTVDDGGNVVDSTYVNCQGNTVNRGNRLHVVQRNLFTVYTGQR